MREAQLYQPVGRWLQAALRAQFPGTRVQAYDTHRRALCRWVEDVGLARVFPAFPAWDIRVDITGLIREKSQARIVLLEVKTASMTLRDIGQILGYARVAQPEYAVLVSLRPPNRSLHTLLCTFRREDVLVYSERPRRLIKLLLWDPRAAAPDLSFMVPQTGSVF